MSNPQQTEQALASLKIRCFDLQEQVNYQNSLLTHLAQVTESGTVDELVAIVTKAFSETKTKGVSNDGTDSESSESVTA